MHLRKVKTEFYASRLPFNDDASCRSLEGYDGPGNVRFKVNDAPLNDGFPGGVQIINGEEYIQFNFQRYSYCVKRSIYEACTEVLPQLLENAHD